MPDLNLASLLRMFNLLGSAPNIDPFGASRSVPSGSTDMRMPGTTFGGDQTFGQYKDIYGNNVPPPQPMDEIPRPNMGAPVPTDMPAKTMADITQDNSYQPSHEASDYYRQLIEHMPQRNKPGIMRKIGASIIGAGYGPDEAMKAEYAPYYRDVEDWKMKLGPAAQAMTNERSINSQERIAAHQQQIEDTQNRRIDETTRHNTEVEKNNAEKTRIAEKRARVYEFKNTHPDWKAEQDSSGKLWFVNPQDPTMKVDTGLDQITDMDKIDLQVSGRLKEIAAQGGQTRQTENLRETNRQKDIAARGQVQKDTTVLRNTIKGPVASHTMTPSATATDRVNKAQQLINEHPEWSKFIKIDGKNVTIPQPVGGWLGNGLTSDVREKIYNHIFGAPESSSMTNQPAIRKEIPGHPGKFAISKDGGKTWTAE